MLLVSLQIRDVAGLCCHSIVGVITLPSPARGLSIIKAWARLWQPRLISLGALSSRVRAFWRFHTVSCQ
eukprot:scaffold200615_cov22-Prasinocladus_malaysianus.AAC.1